MRTRSVLLGLLSIPLGAQVSSVALSATKDVAPAFDSSGARTLPLARLKVDIVYPRGKKNRSELTVVYDPQTGYYLWHVTEANANMPDNTGAYVNIIKAQRAVAFADPAGLIDFAFGDGLFVKAWRRRADSLDAAVSASTNEIQQGLATFEGGSYHMDYKLVPVFGPVSGFNAKMPVGYKSIPPDFKCEPYNSFCPSNNNTIVSISRQGTNWRLVLRNRYDVEIVLDQDFNPVSTRQLTQPKQ